MNPLEEKRECFYCKKELKRLTKTNDWINRCCHLKCHKRVQRLYKLNDYIESMNLKYGTNVPLYPII